MLIDEISKKLIDLTHSSFPYEKRICTVLCGKKHLVKIASELSDVHSWIDSAKFMQECENGVTFISGIAVKFKVINTDNFILYGSNYKDWDNTIDGNTQIAIDKLDNLNIITITNIR